MVLLQEQKIARLST